MSNGCGYAGRIRPDIAWTQIEKALRRGTCVNTRTDLKISFRGDAYELSTYEGPRWVACGQLAFHHHDRHVMHVDFDRDLITDFGYTGYSMTTNRNLNGWMYALLDAGKFANMRSLNGDARGPFDWTRSDRYNKKVVPNRGAGFAEDMFKRFAAGVPWVTLIDGSPWFNGRKYDHDLFRRYERIHHDIVGDGVSWHWFTADWKDGVWSKCFINDAAEARWKKREAKMGKMAA